MSAKATFWAWEQPISSSNAKLVLLCLAQYADADNHAWPSRQTIAEQTALTARTVTTCLAKLEAGGFIERSVRKRDNGSQTSNEFLLLIGGVKCDRNTRLLEDPPLEKFSTPPGKIFHPPLEKFSTPEPTIKNLPLESFGESPKRVRPRDPIFDAIAIGCGINLGEINKANGSMIAKAKQLILESSPQVTPADIEHRCQAYRTKWPKVTLTPTALAKHWPTLGASEEPSLNYLP